MDWRAAVVVSILAVASAPGLSVAGDSPQTVGAFPIALHLPAPLESERASYTADISASVDHVIAWFSERGFVLHRDDLVQTAIVFDDLGRARSELAKHFGVEASTVPDSFCGTVDQKILFVVSRDLYKGTYTRLYPEWPWTDQEYQGLIRHEVTHQAHSFIARSQLGSEEAMGPQWFFEGLAILCAGNFVREGEQRMSWDELIGDVRRSEPKGLSYTIYGYMIRSLAAAFPVKFLVEHAMEKGFPAMLEADYRRAATRVQPQAPR